MKNSLYVVYVLHDDMMNGWLIFNSRFSDVRADHCTRLRSAGFTGTR